jgi:hypothetical protein
MTRGVVILYRLSGFQARDSSLMYETSLGVIQKESTPLMDDQLSGLITRVELRPPETVKLLKGENRS